MSMKPRGLYVVNLEKMYDDGNFVVNAKLSTIYNHLTDYLINKVKGIAEGCQLSEFAIVYVDNDNNRQLLYVCE